VIVNFNLLECFGLVIGDSFKPVYNLFKFFILIFTLVKLNQQFIHLRSKVFSVSLQGVGKANVRSDYLVFSLADVIECFVSISVLYVYFRNGNEQVVILLVLVDK
jgi:hypothetical protein